MDAAEPMSQEEAVAILNGAKFTHRTRGFLMSNTSDVEHFPSKNHQQLMGSAPMLEFDSLDNPEHERIKRALKVLGVTDDDMGLIGDSTCHGFTMEGTQTIKNLVHAGVQFEGCRAYQNASQGMVRSATPPSSSASSTSSKDTVA